MQMTKTQVRRRLRAAASPAVAFLVLIGLGMLAAGCGGSPSGTGVAQLTTTTGNSTTTNSSSTGGSKEGNPTAFSSCMRSHGVPNFPDPKVSGGAIGLTMSRSSGINPRSPQFQAAQRTCQKDMPGPKGGFSTQRSAKP